MTLIASALSVASLALMLVALTLWRAAARESAAQAAFPPTGRFVTVDGIRLDYEMQGQGPDLVLLHGASGNLRDFTFALRDRLVARYRVTVIDRPGLGHSDPLPDNSLSAQARMIKTALARLGVTTPIVLGHSYGGSVALAWALDGGPRALVLVSAPSMPWPGVLDIWYRLTANAFTSRIVIPLVAAFLPRTYIGTVIQAIFAPDAVPPGYADRIGAPLSLRRAALRANTAQINALRDEIVTMEPRYPGLALSVELIHGTADRIVPLNIHSQPLSRLLPNATLTVIEGVGHMPHHSHPDAVIAAIDRAAALR